MTHNPIRKIERGSGHTIVYLDKKRASQLISRCRLLTCGVGAGTVPVISKGRMWNLCGRHSRIQRQIREQSGMIVVSIYDDTHLFQRDVP